MVPHLAADHTPAGAVTCQYAFNRSALLLAELLDGDRLSPEQLSQLRPVVLGIERRDPFGAIDTIIELRRTALSHYVRLQPPADDSTKLQQLSDVARAHYDEWTGDHFLYLRAAKEHAAALEKRGGADEILKAATDELTIERMDGIFSLDALDVIRREGGYVLSLYERGELDVFSGVEMPLLTDFHAKQMRSRSDVRTLHRVLQLSGGLDLHEVTQPPDEDASSSVR